MMTHEVEAACVRWHCLTRPDFDLCDRCFWDFLGEDMLLAGHGFVFARGLEAQRLRFRAILSELENRQRQQKSLALPALAQTGPDGLLYALNLQLRTCAAAMTAAARDTMAFLCDGCDTEIVASRFRCTACLDFDLCEDCFRDDCTHGRHDPDHAFVVFWGAPRPLVAVFAEAVAECLRHERPPVERANMEDHTTWQRLYRIERACFGSEAWTADNLRACADPFKNRHVNVVPSGAGDNEVVAYIAFCLRPVDCDTSEDEDSSDTSTDDDDNDDAGHRVAKTAAAEPRRREVCSIASVAVLPTHQGRSLGSLLLQSVLQQARMRPACSQVQLHVRVSNERAIKLYERHGFARASVVPGYYVHSGEDAYFMVLPLAPR
jgi:ribosomal protein S18 acetylase RimI-like enzyme